MPLIKVDRKVVNRFIRKTYPGARDIRYEVSGAVTCKVDRIPNTDRSGRIFAGWADELWLFCKEN